MTSSREETIVRKKVLLVSPFPVARAGVQCFLLNLVRSVPKEKYKFVWLCSGIEDEKFAQEFEAEGVSIIKIAAPLPVRTGYFKRKYKRLKDFRTLCRFYKIDIVHVNTADRGFQVRYILLAWLCGIPRRIAHGHNYVPNCVPDRRLRMYQYIIVHFSTKLAACSALAARHLCGPRYMARALIFSNRIDTAHFAFSGEVRKAARERLGLTNMLVFGHVGRFNRSKNHAFLIEAFRLVAEENDRARLLLAGGGPKTNEIKELVHSCGLTGKVIFIGSTDCVSEYLCAMDVFVLPSLYEGFPFASLEAQASGLPCIVSDTVPPEAKIAADLTFLPLEGGG